MKDITALSHADAWEIVNSVRVALEQDGRGAAVAVCDDHGELVALLRTDGCPLPSINNAINKAYTASRQRMESRQVGEESRQGNFAMTNFGDLRYTGWGGGVPIMADGEVVGAVGVSGLPEEDDMKIARAGAALIS
ncbi:MAG: heme-binding protein [Acidimicrobiia bacterium]|nr:heme-binding protein [Acidimicrobiia bacterium]MDH3471407.1 heme-binding protein [Acidimicrobiia bacterium]